MKKLLALALVTASFAVQAAPWKIIRVEKLNDGGKETILMDLGSIKMRTKLWTALEGPGHSKQWNDLEVLTGQVRSETPGSGDTTYEVSIRPWLCNPQHLAEQAADLMLLVPSYDHFTGGFYMMYVRGRNRSYTDDVAEELCRHVDKKYLGKM